LSLLHTDRKITIQINILSLRATFNFSANKPAVSAKSADVVDAGYEFERLRDNSTTASHRTLVDEHHELRSSETTNSLAGAGDICNSTSKEQHEESAILQRHNVERGPLPHSMVLGSGNNNKKSRASRPSIRFHHKIQRSPPALRLLGHRPGWRDISLGHLQGLSEIGLQRRSLPVGSSDHGLVLLIQHPNLVPSASSLRHLQITSTIIDMEALRALTIWMPSLIRAALMVSSRNTPKVRTT
jgi:hypothetical protein